MKKPFLNNTAQIARQTGDINIVYDVFPMRVWNLDCAIKMCIPLLTVANVTETCAVIGQKARTVAEGG